MMKGGEVEEAAMKIVCVELDCRDLIWRAVCDEMEVSKKTAEGTRVVLT